MGGASTYLLMLGAQRTTLVVKPALRNSIRACGINRRAVAESVLAALRDLLHRNPGDVLAMHVANQTPLDIANVVEAFAHGGARTARGAARRLGVRCGERTGRTSC